MDDATAQRALRIASAYQKQVLDPVDRFSEVIFGLIMVLTFTGALSVAESGREQVREMLAGALGCNLAWGLVDAVMFVVTSAVERARRAAVLAGVRGADPTTARAIVQAALPEALRQVTGEAEADRLVERLRALPEEPRRLPVEWTDLGGAAGSGLLVVLATLPPTVPFLLMDEAHRALRISNAVAVASLFLAGYWLGKATGVRAWALGLAMVALGGALVAVTIALGG